MQEGPEAPPPPFLRFLKVLVTALAGTMILGLITIIWLFVTRFPKNLGQAPRLPDRIALPTGARAEAVTFGHGWTAVVTDAGDILIFDSASGRLTQSVHVDTGK